MSNVNKHSNLKPNLKYDSKMCNYVHHRYDAIT